MRVGDRHISEPFTESQQEAALQLHPRLHVLSRRTVDREEPQLLHPVLVQEFPRLGSSARCNATGSFLGTADVENKGAAESIAMLLIGHGKVDQALSSVGAAMNDDGRL